MVDMAVDMAVAVVAVTTTGVMEGKLVKAKA